MAQTSGKYIQSAPPATAEYTVSAPEYSANLFMKYKVYQNGYGGLKNVGVDLFRTILWIIHFLLGICSAD